MRVNHPAPLIQSFSSTAPFPACLLPDSHPTPVLCEHSDGYSSASSLYPKHSIRKLASQGESLLVFDPDARLLLRGVQRRRPVEGRLLEDHESAGLLFDLRQHFLALPVAERGVSRLLVNLGGRDRRMAEQLLHRT